MCSATPHNNTFRRIANVDNILRSVITDSRKVHYLLIKTKYWIQEFSSVSLLVFIFVIFIECPEVIPVSARC